MTGHEIQYPVLAFPPGDSDPVAFADWDALFIFERAPPPLGYSAVAEMIDAGGRLWRVDGVRGYGLWGSWWQRLELWLLRQRVVDLDLAKGELLGFEQIRTKLLDLVDRQAAALAADNQISAGAKPKVLAAWSEIKESVQEAGSFETLCQLAGYRKLPNKGWFTATGRAGRREFFAIATAGCLMAAALFTFWPLHRRDSLVLIFVEMGLTLAIGWVVFCVTLRRLHDANQGGYWLYAPAVLTGLLDASAKHHQISIGLENLIAAALIAVFLLLVGFLNGVSEDNMFGPNPATLV